MSATALLGFLTSIALLHLHLHNIALRYIISVAVAYAGFLGLIRFWILSQQKTWQRAGAIGAEPVSLRSRSSNSLSVNLSIPQSV